MTVTMTSVWGEPTGQSAHAVAAKPTSVAADIQLRVGFPVHTGVFAIVSSWRKKMKTNLIILWIGWYFVFCKPRLSSEPEQVLRACCLQCGQTVCMDRRMSRRWGRFRNRCVLRNWPPVVAWNSAAVTGWDLATWDSFIFCVDKVRLQFVPF